MQVAMKVCPMGHMSETGWKGFRVGLSSSCLFSYSQSVLLPMGQNDTEHGNITLNSAPDTPVFQSIQRLVTPSSLCRAVMPTHLHFWHDFRKERNRMRDALIHSSPPPELGHISLIQWASGCSPSQKHHLGMCWKCKFSGPSQIYWIRNSGIRAWKSVVNKSCRWWCVYKLLL